MLLRLACLGITNAFALLQTWKAKRASLSGHEGRYDLRAIVNAIFYQRTCCRSGLARQPGNLVRGAAYMVESTTHCARAEEVYRTLRRSGIRGSGSRTVIPTEVGRCTTTRLLSRRTGPTSTPR